MKKIIISILFFPFIFSCSNEHAEKFQKENNQLKKESTLKDSTIKKFVRSFNQIVDNMHSISESQKEIASTVRKKKKLSAEDKNHINEYVNTINSLSEKNKSLADSMKTNFSASKINFGEFDKMLINLQSQIEEKNSEINSLKQNLSEADIAYNTFDDMVDKLSTANVDMEKKMKQLQTTIDQQQKELNTAYYIFGTYKELKDAGVVSKSGISRVENTQKNFSTTKFIKVDIRETKNINVWSSSFRVISNHSPDSYKTEKSSLIITNPDEFWKLTKYLVVIKD